MKITYLKPNHICQNQKCNKGKNGEPKHYYACDYCGWSENWRSLCCSRECFIEMTELDRKKDVSVAKHKKPKRTDMTVEQVDAMMEQTMEEVMEKTMEELVDYKETIDTIGLGSVIDLINEELDQLAQSND